MVLVTSAQMRAIEEFTINKVGIPQVALMEHAALAVTSACLRAIAEINIKRPRVAVVCGSGNNGGDGFACARQLFVKGIDVVCVCTGWQEEKLTGAARINFDILKELNTPIHKDTVPDADIIIDAMVGTGLSGGLTDKYAEYAVKINASGAYVIAVDVPSGLNSDRGAISGEIVKADLTVTFGCPKVGLFVYPGAGFAGKIEVADIGLPPSALSVITPEAESLTDDEAKNLLPPRPARSNKGDYGKLAVYAGSDAMPGAALLCARAAYRAGAGLVTPFTTAGAADLLRHGLPEAITTTVEYPNFPDNNQNATAAIIGCGLGNNDKTKRYVERLLTTLDIPIVIDADGLNVICENRDLLKKYKRPIIITPHPGEMARLTGKAVTDILGNVLTTAREFAAEYGVTVLLKDARTIVARPDGLACVNVTGTPAMAKAGSGDVLAGIIGGLLAQGLGAYDAARLGAYVHGRAGELAAEELGLRGVLAGDLADRVPTAVKYLFPSSEGWRAAPGWYHKER